MSEPNVMAKTLYELNQKRKEEYKKMPEEENFLQAMNLALQERELKLYQDFEIDQPFLFVFGLPRSGTTLLAQVLAYSLDVGYINNLMARFWLAPVHGIRLSKHVLGNEKQISFQSHYARTPLITDIHEFGYFWRYWLQKESVDAIVHSEEYENKIDWEGLRKVLANIQKEFEKPMVFKNMFGAHHMRKLREILGTVLFVYIERDPLDVAISILDARKKYYDDLNIWWSNIPPEYYELKDLDYWHQIAGQVHYLRKFYNRQIAQCGEAFVVRVHYLELCDNPAGVIQKIVRQCQRVLGNELMLRETPPNRFPFHTYPDRKKEKKIFAELLDQLEAKTKT